MYAYHPHLVWNAKTSLSGVPERELDIALRRAATMVLAELKPKVTPTKKRGMLMKLYLGESTPESCSDSEAMQSLAGEEEGGRRRRKLHS